MGKIWMPGGIGGADFDVVTAESSDVEVGKIFLDKNGEPAVGSLGLDGDALPANVLAGRTFYNKKLKVKETGTMTIQSILSFSAAVYSSTAIAFTWKNPAKGPFSGVIIVGKTGSYPTSISDGTRYYKGIGNNTAASGTSSTTASSFASGLTYYFRTFSYAIKDGAEWIATMTYTATASTTKGQQVITSSGTFTIPAGVRSVDIFCVGGGGGGAGGGRNSSSYSAGGGGGSGYTYTQKNISVTPGLNLSITIGAGGSGAPADSYGSGGNGGSTTIKINNNTYTANGGYGAAVTPGGAGGSGGGGAGDFYSNGGKGGSNGSNGNSASMSGGYGQETTTRAFAESSNTLYSGGGGGGASGSGGGSGRTRGIGGTGGGGNGADAFNSGSNGGINTGGGGGGGYQYSPGGAGYVGGSGICIIRWGY